MGEVTLKLTTQEANTILTLMNYGLMARGDVVADAYVILRQKIVAAMQQEPLPITVPSNGSAERRSVK